MGGTGDPTDAGHVTTDDPAVVANGVGTPVPFAKAVAKAERGSPDHQAGVLESLAHAATLPLAEDHPTGCALCQRCEVLPVPLAGPGTLHLNLPHTHTLGKVLQALGHAGEAYARRDGTVVVPVAEGGPGRVLSLVAGILTSTERRDARALFQPAGVELVATDYFRVDSLTAVLAKVDTTWLLELLRGSRLTSHF